MPLNPHIHFFCDGVNYLIRHKKDLKAWILHCIALQKKNPGQINIILCNDNYLSRFNKKYLNHHTLTDIITFDYSTTAAISGDIFISIERIKDNAKVLNNSTKDELHRVIIHGILHLCGYKDKSPSEKLKMTSAENKCLSLRSF